jgi:hypothetical protein
MEIQEFKMKMLIQVERFEMETEGSSSNVVELSEQAEQDLHSLIFAAMQFFKTIRDTNLNTQGLQLSNSMMQEKNNYLQQLQSLQMVIAQLTVEILL